MFTKQINYLVFALAFLFLTNVLQSNATPLPAIFTRDDESITLYVRDVKPMDQGEVEMMFDKRGAGVEYVRGKASQAGQWAKGHANNAANAYNQSKAGQAINSTVRTAGQKVKAGASYVANSKPGQFVKTHSQNAYAAVKPHAQTAMRKTSSAASAVGSFAKSGVSKMRSKMH